MTHFGRLGIGLGAAAASLALSGAASANEPEAVATYSDWSVFVREVDGDKICFAATEAADKSPKTVTHGGVFFLVATWESGAAKHQPSLMTGYNMDDRPKPSLRIGSEKWDMYVSKNEAFIESDREENTLVSAMRKGADMRVSAVSARGTATSYNVSLRGVTKALERAESACR
ncbi:MAG: invasion associated locus B family protein [Parvularculaceae bacterium]